jgi:hypothetical protein
MIEVTVMTIDGPIEVGVRFELVSPDGKVLSSGITDAAGVVSFGIESAGLGSVGVRLAREQAGPPTAAS